ncbi:hypothetical protein B0H17DRAFT_1146451 [Mycena rosella]|uniref:Uncharacterized protein n=1 Tax=Mycena rosella TaxID=1033263 RepID=A0AAD7G4W1_MYCRO|nr:hypothetical protein B0H17DRAFT_1146451 [Mycena rosella]
MSPRVLGTRLGGTWRPSTARTVCHCAPSNGVVGNIFAGTPVVDPIRGGTYGGIGEGTGYGLLPIVVCPENRGAASKMRIGRVLGPPKAPHVKRSRHGQSVPKRPRAHWSPSIVTEGEEDTGTGDAGGVKSDASSPAVKLSCIVASATVPGELLVGGIGVKDGKLNEIERDRENENGVASEGSSVDYLWLEGLLNYVGKISGLEHNYCEELESQCVCAPSQILFTSLELIFACDPKEIQCSVKDAWTIPLSPWQLRGSQIANLVLGCFSKSRN